MMNYSQNMPTILSCLAKYYESFCVREKEVRTCLSSLSRKTPFDTLPIFTTG